MSKHFKSATVRVKNKNGKYEMLPALRAPSGYELAKACGYKGTEEEWVNSTLTEGWLTAYQEMNSRILPADTEIITSLAPANVTYTFDETLGDHVEFDLTVPNHDNVTDFVDLRPLGGILPNDVSRYVMSKASINAFYEMGLYHAKWTNNTTLHCEGCGLAPLGTIKIGVILRKDIVGKLDNDDVRSGVLVDTHPIPIHRRGQEVIISLSSAQYDNGKSSASMTVAFDTVVRNDFATDPFLHDVNSPLINGVGGLIVPKGVRKIRLFGNVGAGGNGMGGYINMRLHKNGALYNVLPLSYTYWWDTTNHRFSSPMIFETYDIDVNEGDVFTVYYEKAGTNYAQDPQGQFGVNGASYFGMRITG